jgi:hypothetical protein
MSSYLPAVVTLDDVASMNTGIPRYWVVDRDAAQTVTLHVLGADKTYEVAAKMPLAWLLQTAPADHRLGD